GHGRPCHPNDRGGTAATDYTQGRLKMQPSGHTRFYTTLTDATGRQELHAHARAAGCHSRAFPRRPGEHLQFGVADHGSGCHQGLGPMIPIPSGVRVWLALGHTDMRRGMRSLALQVQQTLHKDVHAGDLYVFRGRSGSLCKILWHDGLGMSLYAKRLERGRFVWPSAKDGTIAISASAMACLLEGVDWRNPQETWRPAQVG
ncbi:IS66 family insertion sequence element accessory protein TnpB, partial [Sphingobium olei]